MNERPTERLRRELQGIRQAGYWQEARRRLSRARNLASNVAENDTKFETAKVALVNVHGQLVDTISLIEGSVPAGPTRTTILARLNKMRADLLEARDAAS